MNQGLWAVVFIKLGFMIGGIYCLNGEHYVSAVLFILMSLGSTYEQE